MALVVSGKFIGGFASAKVFLRATTNRSAYLFGSWFIPRGEFSFVIGQLAPPAAAHAAKRRWKGTKTFL
jgi:Kef-type K+ transport system membrane component KefB